ncbi:hypothetical protein IMZ48_49335 [Candidatus Bathyarchaeota archaeon]|nr:hypothetical protein [Candidatus Bathyarchaeota archaeon]
MQHGEGNHGQGSSLTADSSGRPHAGQRPDHATRDRAHGGSSTQTPAAAKGQRKIWPGKEDAGRAVEENGEESVAACEACGEEGHVSVNYESLRMDLPPRQDPQVPGSTKMEPHAPSPTGTNTLPTGTNTLPCNVCGGLDHETAVCMLLGLYKTHGESANIPPEAKERCRQMRARGELPVCEVCMKYHLTHHCVILAAYCGHGDYTGIPEDAKKRCHEWLQSERSGLGSGTTSVYQPRVCCTICSNIGHPGVNCFYLKSYRLYGDGMSGVREDIKKRCSEWLTREWWSWRGARPFAG